MRRPTLILVLALALLVPLALVACGGSEEVYNANGCGGCHALEAAGSSGAVGPNLDESQPSFELVVDRVTNGAGAMPAFGDQLEEQQIADVAAFVVESTSG